MARNLNRYTCMQYSSSSETKLIVASHTEGITPNKAHITVVSLFLMLAQLSIIHIKMYQNINTTRRVLIRLDEY